MALTQLECLAFLIGGSTLVVLVGYELDGLEQSAGRLALPHFAEAAASQRFDQPIAGNRLRARLTSPLRGWG